MLLENYLFLNSFLADTLSVITIFLGLILYFKDPLRRWSFFGYKPAVMIMLYDRKSDKVLLVKHSKFDVWYFPQGSIYSTNMNEVVDQTLTREISVPNHLYKFVKTVPLGTIRRRRSYLNKYYPEMISIFTTTRGKGYLACLCETNLESFLKKSKAGWDVGEVKLFKLAEALEIIDPKKKQLIEDHKTELFD